VNGAGRVSAAAGSGRVLAAAGSGRVSAAARLLLVGLGVMAARAAARAWRRADGPAWRRTNFRGATVSLTGGPALATAATFGAAAGAPGPAAAGAVLVAGLGASAVGLYDDLVGHHPHQRVAKGFHGHLAALRHGRVTSGVIKIVGAAGAGLAAAVLLEHGRGRPGGPCPGGRWSAGNVLLGAGVIAGAANLVNLLDLRPGRALKVGLLAGLPLVAGPAGGLAAGTVGACAGSLPEDLVERTMLGDSGANALGALLGVALVARTGPAGRAVALAAIGALTATSEKVSFTRVIARTPVLRELDHLGRRKDPPADG
jgi:UDP-N-acetylmuramyl pentapeptide phosphotransferase/UDP-N-acetylglucosamine-1-phosphate transferase